MRYFTFEFEGKPCGYYEEDDQDGVLYAKAHFFIDGVEVENPFWLKYEGDDITAYRAGPEPFRPYQQSVGVFPGSAIRFILKAMGNKSPFEFIMFNERDSQLLGQTTWVRENKTIKEYRDDVLQRHFVLEKGQVVEYGWGGPAVSRIVGSYKEAIRGTPFEIEKES